MLGKNTLGSVPLGQDFFAGIAAIELTPLSINSNSQSFDPVIQYASLLSLSPGVINSGSISLDPLVEYKAVINITAQVINSASVSLNPFVSSGATQTVGTVTASFAPDLYTVRYKA